MVIYFYFIRDFLKELKKDYLRRSKLIYSRFLHFFFKIERIIQITFDFLETERNSYSF